MCECCWRRCSSGDFTDCFSLLPKQIKSQKHIEVFASLSREDANEWMEENKFTSIHRRYFFHGQTSWCTINQFKPSALLNSHAFPPYCTPNFLHSVVSSCQSSVQPHLPCCLSFVQTVMRSVIDMHWNNFVAELIVFRSHCSSLLFDFQFFNFWSDEKGLNSLL